MPKTVRIDRFRKIYLKPTFPRSPPNSGKSYRRLTAMRTASLPKPSDGMISAIDPRLEGHTVIFLATQTHLSCRFLPAVNSLGLLRSGSSSQFIDPPRDFPKQVPGNGDSGQFERDVPAMADIFGTDLDELFSQPFSGQFSASSDTADFSFGSTTEVQLSPRNVCSWG